MEAVLDTILLAILAFPIQRSILLREYKNGNYAILPWFMARILVAAIFCILYEAVVALPVFFMQVRSEDVASSCFQKPALLSI